MGMAEIYFLKAAQLGAAPVALGRVLCWLSAGGTLLALWVFRRRQIWPLLLLWLPLPFYAYSVAYGSVPIFIPMWRPHSWYNTRYGMELLPAFALFAGCLLPLLATLWAPRYRRYVLAAASCWSPATVCVAARPAAGLSGGGGERTQPGRAGARIDECTAGHPGKGLILMQVSSHVGAVQQAGIPLKRVVNEGDYLVWQHALEHPAHSVATVVAFDGDLVAQAVKRHPEGLQEMNVICSTGQPCAHIYRSQVAAGN